MISGKELAGRLGVARSTLSEATKKGYRVLGRYDVQDWAVVGSGGRVRGYEVPHAVGLTDAHRGDTGRGGTERSEAERDNPSLQNNPASPNNPVLQINPASGEREAANEQVSTNGRVTPDGAVMQGGPNSPNEPNSGGMGPAGGASEGDSSPEECSSENGSSDDSPEKEDAPDEEGFFAYPSLLPPGQNYFEPAAAGGGAYAFGKAIEHNNEAVVTGGLTLLGAMAGNALGEGNGWAILAGAAAGFGIGAWMRRGAPADQALQGRPESERRLEAEASHPAGDSVIPLPSDELLQATRPVRVMPASHANPLTALPSGHRSEQQ